MLLSGIAIAGCSRIDVPRYTWPHPPATTQLDRAWPPIDDIAFSDNGQYLALRWLPEDEISGVQWPFGGGRVTVLDRNGRPVANAVDEQGVLRKPFADRFPSIVWHQRFGRFLHDAQAWGFNADLTACVKLTLKHPGVSGDKVPQILELWRFDGVERRIWSVELPPDWMGILGRAYFQKTGHGGRILLPYAGDVYILDEATGNIIQVLKLACFCNPTAFDPSTNRLAVVREEHIPTVIDVAHGGATVFALKPEASWKGLYWSVIDLSFGGGGQYLIVYYNWSNTSRVWYRGGCFTEIYRLSDGKRIWRGKSVRAVLSDDGRWAAVLGKNLEVGPFSVEASGH